MKLFYNESSIEKYCDFKSGLIFFWKVAQAKTPHVRLYRDSWFYGNYSFLQRFNSELSGELRGPIRSLLFGNKHAECWRDQRISTAEVEYTLPTQEVLSDDSMCEAAEHQLKNDRVLVLSFPDTKKFDSSSISLCCNSSETTVNIDNARDAEIVLSTLASFENTYDTNSKSPPPDCQTVLCKEPRFTRTKKFERKGNRSVYLEAGSGFLYYVDNFHFGNGAHLEVFDSNEVYIGTADINTGAIDRTNADKSRILRW